MIVRLNRREFLRTSLAVAAATSLPPTLAHGDAATSFSFILLGDLHFDKLAHHDFQWLERNKPDDLSQIKGYSRNTAETTPQLFATVRQTIAERNQQPASRVAFVLQVGDLVEGLCGTEELATRQNQEAVDFVRAANFGVPFLFTKGNHDVTGDGAAAAFARVFYPFLSEQTASFAGGGKIATAHYAVEHADSLICCFDAYDTESLDWLAATLSRRTARNCFVVVHPPVVPYGARATWYLYPGEKHRAKRDKLLELLGREQAFVLGGHLHKFSAIARTTRGGGRFAQLAVSSVINDAKVQPKNVLSGRESYNGDQVRVEPSYSPGTEPERRAVYEAERPLVTAFEYADHPGYAVVTVSGESVKATLYSGITRQAWTTVDLTKLLES